MEFDIDNIELLPCPFCGGKAVINRYRKDGLEIKCQKCRIKKQQRVIRHTINWLCAALVFDWNNRYPFKEDE